MCSSAGSQSFVRFIETHKTTLSTKVNACAIFYETHATERFYLQDVDMVHFIKYRLEYIHHIYIFSQPQYIAAKFQPTCIEAVLMIVYMEVGNL